MVNSPEPLVAFDVNTVRADFPILDQMHHDDVPLVYLDNAATSQKPLQVIEAVDEYYRRFNANVHRGIHKLSEEATTAYEKARIKVQRFINAPDKREIIFTRGTTEGINLVAQSWGRANLQSGDVVVLTVMEHHSNIVPWQLLAVEKGFTIKYVPVLSDGTLDLDVYASLLRDEAVKLVAFMHVSNVLGTINPAKSMIEQAHAAGALVLLDGAQSVPHMAVDVQDLGADFLVFSGHKMIGPTGIGVLYGRRELLEAMPPWMGGGDMIATVHLDHSTWNDLPYKFEAGTPIIASAIGLGYAVDYLSQVGMDRILVHEHQVTGYALERLVEIPGVKVYGPESDQKAGVVAFTVEGIHAHDLAQVLDMSGIAVRAGHHCAMPLHESLGLAATARSSFYLYNTLHEVDQLAEALYMARKLFA